MDNVEGSVNNAHSSEGSAELNGEDASYRQANMISPPRTVLKRRIRGALVPIGKLQ